jgi:hypothetical protein
LTGPPRHPLGLPAGSIRGLLALAVLAMLWTVVLTSLGKQLPLLYVYLQYLMVLIFAHYFAAHGNTIGYPYSDRQPLGLPRGSVRTFLILGFAGLVAWMAYHKQDYQVPPTTSFLIPIILVCGFLLGFFLTRVMRVVGGGQPPYWFQDIEAWAAIVGMLGLVGEVLIQVFINPTLSDEQLYINATYLETGLAAVVGFYFGARS